MVLRSASSSEPLKNENSHFPSANVCLMNAPVRPYAQQCNNAQQRRRYSQFDRHRYVADPPEYQRKGAPKVCKVREPTKWARKLFKLPLDFFPACVLGFFFFGEPRFGTKNPIAQKSGSPQFRSLR